MCTDDFTLESLELKRRKADLVEAYLYVHECLMDHKTFSYLQKDNRVDCRTTPTIYRKSTQELFGRTFFWKQLD